jgi:soluble P-type ATPase
MNTLKRILVSVLIAAAGAAFAASAEYTETVKKIDAAMATGKFTPSTTDEAKKLRADSERMMKENKEAEAMKLLEKVKQLLNMK